MDILIVLDPVVVIFRSVKHCYGPLEGHRVVGVGEVLIPERG